MFSFVLSIVLTSAIVIAPCLFFLSFVTWKNAHPSGKKLSLFYALAGLAALIIGMVHMFY